MRQAQKKSDQGWLSGYTRAEAARFALRRAQEEAQAARHEADEARRAKAAFLSGLNHELRTPLNAITGFAGLLRETMEHDIPEAKKAEYLDHILHSAGILLERIDAILQAAGRDVPSGAEGPTDVVPILRRLIQEHAASLFVGKVDIADELPETKLSARDLYLTLRAVFTALVNEGGERQALGLSAHPAGQGGIVLRFVLLTAKPRIDQKTLRALRAQLQKHGVTLAVETGGEASLGLTVVLPSTDKEFSS